MASVVACGLGAVVLDVAVASVVAFRLLAALRALVWALRRRSALSCAVVLCLGFGLFIGIVSGNMEKLWWLESFVAGS